MMARSRTSTTFLIAIAIFLLLLSVSSPRTLTDKLIDRMNDAFTNPASGHYPSMLIEEGTCAPVNNPVLVVLFIIGVLILSVAVLTYYLIAKAYDSHVLISKAKNWGFSILNAFVSLALIAVFIYVISPAFLTALSYLNEDPIYKSTTGNYKPLVVSAIGISNMFAKKIATEYGILIIYNAQINALYSATLWFGVTWMSTWQFNLGPALRPAIDTIGMALNMLSLALTAWVATGSVLCFMNKWGFFMVLFGFFLSVIPPTSKAGSIILSVVFAFFLMYPMMIILNYETYKVLISSPKLDELGLFELSTTGTSILMFLMGTAILGSLSAPLAYLAMLKVITTTVSTSILYVFLFSFFLPFLNITITLTFANETAKSFGVVTNFMSFMRLI